MTKSSFKISIPFIAKMLIQYSVQPGTLDFKKLKKGNISNYLKKSKKLNIFWYLKKFKKRKYF